MHPQITSAQGRTPRRGSHPPFCTLLSVPSAPSSFLCSRKDTAQSIPSSFLYPPFCALCALLLSVLKEGHRAEHPILLSAPSFLCPLRPPPFCAQGRTPRRASNPPFCTLLSVPSAPSSFVCLHFCALCALLLCVPSFLYPLHALTSAHRLPSPASHPSHLSAPPALAPVPAA